MNEQLPIEYERKFDVSGAPEAYRKFMWRQPISIEQYYVNYLNEPYELRFRKSTPDHRSSYTATVKRSMPPDRLEVETAIKPETFRAYEEYEKGRIHKIRRVIPQALGHWALDLYPDTGLALLEAEGEEVDVPSFGREVTRDTSYTNSMLAREQKGPQTLFQCNRLVFPELVNAIESRRDGRQPVVVGVAGATGSGKTTVARRLTEVISDSTLLSMDDYYKGRTVMRERHGIAEPNWDEPLALDLDQLVQDIAYFQTNVAVDTPVYDMSVSEPAKATRRLNPEQTPVLVIEGLYTLLPALRSLLNHSVYVDAPVATRVGRRLERDVAEGRTFAPEENLRYCLEVAEPTFQQHGARQAHVADHLIRSV